MLTILTFGVTNSSLVTCDVMCYAPWDWQSLVTTILRVSPCNTQSGLAGWVFFWITASGWMMMMRFLNWISAKSCMSMRDFAEIQWRNLMNQYPPTHWGLFLPCDVFVAYISIKLFIFMWKSMDYLFIVKIATASSQQKMFQMTAPFTKFVVWNALH